MPITRRSIGPDAVWTAIRSPSCVPAARAMSCSTTATRARVLSWAGVYQRPARDPVMEHRGLAGRPRRSRPSPASLTSVTKVGSMLATPGVARIRRAACASSGRRPCEEILTSSPWSPHEARLVSLMPAASPSTASRVPTANAITSAVERLRRLRRPTLRRPICAVRGRKPDPPQEAIARVLAADGGAGRLQRLAQRQAHRTPDRGQRRERRREQADQRADEQDARVDAEADVDRKGRAERRWSARSRAQSRARSRRRFRSRRAGAPSSGRRRRSGGGGRRSLA